MKAAQHFISICCTVCFGLLCLTLCVVAQDSPEWTYTPPAQLTGKKDGTVALQCKARGIPAPNIMWYKDGVVLTSTNLVQVNKTQLQINKLSQENVGRYKCVASNPYGYISYTTAVILEGGALITQFPQNMTVAEGQSVRFDCSATADPNNITYSWYKDGINVNSISTFKKRVSISEDGSLNFNTVRIDDAGVYRCVAYNGVGSFSAEAYMAVTSSPRFDKSKHRPILYFGVGQEALIGCPVIANPPVTSVVWRKFPSSSPKGTLELSPPSRYSMTRDYSLVITNVTKGDVGMYNCIATNNNGDATSEGVQVYVKDLPYFSIKPNASYVIKAHDTVMIPCQAEPPAGRSVSFSRPVITWKKGNDAMPEATRLLFSSGNLTITNAEKSDGGVYECMASFDEVSVSTYTELVVQSTTPYAPHNVTAAYGHYDITVSWVPGFDGGFPQSFALMFKETARADGPLQRLAVPEHRGLPQHKIYGLRPDTEYQVQVLAMNKLGDGILSKAIIGKTQGYAPGAVGNLPTDDQGRIYFPNIEKAIGPAPSAPLNFSVMQEESGAVYASWVAPAETETAVPILYYRLEYKTSGSQWLQDKPVLANETLTKFSPDKLETDKTVTYYIRARSYGLLAYSTYTEARIVVLNEVTVSTLSQGAIIGIAIAALVFVAMIVIVVVVIMDVSPCCRHKKRSSTQDARGTYMKAAEFSNGTSKWQSYYPYYGGRFAVDDEADEIFVVENARQNALYGSTVNRTEPAIEQGWYFPRDNLPDNEFISAQQDQSSNYYNTHGLNRYSSNYPSNYSSMQGYYDARTGVQISPQTRTNPYSNRILSHTDELDDVVINLPLHDAKDSNAQLPSQVYEDESHPIPTTNSESWFAPFAAYNTISSCDLSLTAQPAHVPFEPKQEVLLRPSLPRHSSMKPSRNSYIPENHQPFDPNLSSVRETDTPYHQEVEYYNFSQPLYGYSADTLSSVQRLTADILQDLRHLRGDGSHQHSYRSNNTHSYLSPAYHGSRQSSIRKKDLERRSSSSSNNNEVHKFCANGVSHKANSLHSKQLSSHLSANSYTSQLSPSVQTHHNYQLPYLFEHEPERYPELTSPNFYNNNNNRNNLVNRSASQISQFAMNKDISRQTSSGLGTTYSTNIDNITGTRTSLDQIREQSLPTYYRTSGSHLTESSPRLNNKGEGPQWARYNPQQYLPKNDLKSYQKEKVFVTRSVSDSVDENYEFDPVLNDLEPQDFFHIHDDFTNTEGTTENLFANRQYLYAENSQQASASSSQRFEKLRKEYLEHRDSNTRLQTRPYFNRLESEIL